jgi:hypothetical protein
MMSVTWREGQRTGFPSLKKKKSEKKRRVNSNYTGAEDDAQTSTGNE